MSDSQLNKESDSINETSDSNVIKITDNNNTINNNEDDTCELNEELSKNKNKNKNEEDEDEEEEDEVVSKREDEGKKKKKKNLSARQVSSSNNIMVSVPLLTSQTSPSPLVSSSEGYFIVPRYSNLRSTDERKRSAFNSIISFLFKSGHLQKKEFDGLLSHAKNIKDSDLLGHLKSIVGNEKLSFAINALSPSSNSNQRRQNLAQVLVRPAPLSSVQNYPSQLSQSQQQPSPSQKNIFLRASSTYMPSSNSTRTSGSITSGSRVMQQQQQQQSHISSFAPQYMNTPAVSTTLNHHHHQINNNSNPSINTKNIIQNMRHSNSSSTSNTTLKNANNPVSVSMSAVMGTPVSMPHPMLRAKQGNFNVINNKLMLQSRASGNSSGNRGVQFTTGAAYGTNLPAHLPYNQWGNVSNPTGVYLDICGNPFFPGSATNANQMKGGLKREAQTLPQHAMPPTKRVPPAEVAAPQPPLPPPPLPPGDPTDEIFRNIRGSRSRRPVEDPNAPEMNSGDVINSTEIQLNEEHKELFNQFKSARPEDNPVCGDVKSNVFNVNVLSNIMAEEVEKHGLSIEGTDTIEAFTKGLEERFSAFMKNTIDLSIHRHMPIEQNKITSDIRSKINEIKKQNAECILAKEKAEREKLEKLADTATRKELAANKELASKVELIKREREFSAEAAATNRALSVAFGGLGFEKYRRRKKENEIREREKDMNRNSLNLTPQQNLNLNANVNLNEEHPLIIDSENKEYDLEQDQTKKVSIALKDIITAMSQDNEFSHSKKLFEMHLK